MRLEENKVKDLRSHSLDLTTFRGGFTYCAPGCFNNAKKVKTLSFYRIHREVL